MKEQLVSFETAKLAKKKGFKEKCSSAYVYRNEYHQMPNYKADLIHTDILLCDISAPTQSLLQKWLREKYQLEVIVKSWIEAKELCFLFSTQKLGVPSSYMNKNNFKTYEEALEAGLQEALKLI